MEAAAQQRQQQGAAPPADADASAAPAHAPQAAHHARAMHASHSPRSAPDAAPQPPPAAGGGRGRGRGGRGRGRTAAAAEPEPLVRLGEEVAKDSVRLRTGWHPVRLSCEDKAAELELDERQLAAGSTGGYKMVRATHGAYRGAWYYEVRVDHLGPAGAARLGWATRQAELNAPVGANEFGFGYRSKEGSKVHKAWRDDYGQPYGRGDVVGCLLHLPEGGRPLELSADDAVKYKGKTFFPETDHGGPAQPLPGALVAFYLNGTLQGTAYSDVPEGTYYPALSLWTHRGQQSEAAEVTCNFGDGAAGWAFPPRELPPGCPPPRPVSELPGPRPGAPAAAAKQQEQQREQQQQAAAAAVDNAAQPQEMDAS